MLPSPSGRFGMLFDSRCRIDFDLSDSHVVESWWDDHREDRVPDVAIGQVRRLCPSLERRSPWDVHEIWGSNLAGSKSNPKAQEFGRSNQASIYFNVFKSNSGEQLDWLQWHHLGALQSSIIQCVVGYLWAQAYSRVVGVQRSSRLLCASTTQHTHTGRKSGMTGVIQRYLSRLIRREGDSRHERVPNLASYSKIYSYTVTQKNLQLLKKSTVTPEKHPKDILIHR